MKMPSRNRARSIEELRGIGIEGPGAGAGAGGPAGPVPTRERARGPEGCLKLGLDESELCDQLVLASMNLFLCEIVKAWSSQKVSASKPWLRLTDARAGSRGIAIKEEITQKMLFLDLRKSIFRCQAC